MKGIEQRTHFSVTYEDDDKIEKLENKLFNLCVGYEEAPIYLKGYPRLIKRLNEGLTKKFMDTKFKKKQSVFPYPRAKWEDYIILGLNETKIKVRNLLNKREDVFSYVDLKMVDKQTQQPNRVWQFQMALISNDGFLPLEGIGDQEKTKKIAARYNSRLKELFRINERIYRNHSEKEGGYRLRIQTQKAYKPPA
jgi:hypothetical protein